MPNYEIGAYYFPGYHTDERISSWHGRGWTEWNLLKVAQPRFPNHLQPKAPVWGYEDESSPDVMARKARTAAEHGVGHFIFDWYFYRGAPFLSRCLDEGFLGIEGGPPVKFALMWANHDWLNIQPARLDGINPVLLPGAVSPAEFRAIADHVVARYFCSPHYWTIDGRPYFSIYDLPALLRGLGGINETREAFTYLRTSARRAGLPGVHLNLVHWQNRVVGSFDTVTGAEQVIHALGFDSLSSYVWVHHFEGFTFPETPYTELMERNCHYWQETAANFSIPYFPNVTMGWDASPRTVLTDAFEDRGYPFMATVGENSPTSFRSALAAAKQHVDARPLPTKHVSINAWNEWTEGSYLEPDTVNGYAYLEAIRDVFGVVVPSTGRGCRAG